jgi:hypothetical protein
MRSRRWGRRYWPIMVLPRVAAADRGLDIFLPCEGSHGVVLVPRYDRPRGRRRQGRRDPFAPWRAYPIHALTAI